MGFTEIKFVHMVLAGISILGFTWRGAVVVLRGLRLSSNFWRTAPHVIDTALLGSGTWLAWQSAQYPFANSVWLSTKMLALLAYIAFGLLALRYAQGPTLRLIYYLLALACAWVMVFTAVHKSPLFI